jgi:hypothetical protein
MSDQSDSDQTGSDEDNGYDPPIEYDLDIEDVSRGGDHGDREQR